MALSKGDTPRVLLWTLGLVLLMRLFSLTAYPLTETTEARYAEIGRKMAELGDWITPWYDYGVPFWAKPPLSTWITAGGMKLFGFNEFGARLPHFVAGLLVLALVGSWARYRSARESWLAVALLSGAALFFIAAGAVMTDMALAVGLMLTMRGFWFGLYGEPSVRRREGWLLFIGLAVGLLAKGPIALVLAGLPLCGWTLATRRLPDVWRRLPWFRGMLLMLALSLPWYVAAELKTPGFLEYFLLGEHWQRFTVAGWSGDRYGNAHVFARGSIWLFALASCLPWPLLLPWFARHRQRDTSTTGLVSGECSYLWAWALAPCLFFTAAGNILWTYVLPSLPALALLTSAWLADDIRVRRVNGTVTAGLLLTLLMGAAVFGSQNGTLARKSAKALVQAYSARAAHEEPLIFVGTRPYSAQFYTAGKVMWADSSADARAKLPAGEAFLAFRSGTPAKGDLGVVATDLGQFGAYRLFAVSGPKIEVRLGERPRD